MYEIMIGFCTGSPEHKNQSWFYITEKYPNTVSLSNVIFLTRYLGYQKSDDICADFIFWIKLDDEFLKDSDVLQAELNIALEKEKEFSPCF